MGEGRYRPLLCLIQVAVADGDGRAEVEVLDPLDEEFDCAPLADVLADPEIEIVLHAGRQDVALLRRVWGTDVRNVFDTQVAAGFAGMRAQIGYEALLQRAARRAAAQERELHALGRAPAERRAGRLRARGRPAPAPGSRTR